MSIRHAIFVLSGWLLLGSGLTGQPLRAAPATEVLARIHWLGLDRMSTDTNAAHLMSVWRLPQTTAQVAQTLDKFSRWPGGGATNAAGARLRPLLDDLVSAESYWELSVPTNLQPAATDPRVFLAVRLPADRARLWQTNLADAVKDLTGVRPVPGKDGWILQQSHAPQRIEFSRAGEWTLVGWGPDTDSSLSKFADRVIRDHASSANHVWLEAELNPLRLFPGLTTINYQLSTISNCHFTAIGKDGNVLTRGTFNFSRPLNLSLPPWEIPTNLIHGPLTSFAAVRGFAPWLAATPAWKKLGLTPPSDQAYFWALDGIPFQSYFVAPLPAASNQVWRLAGRLVQNANPWLATNAQGSFQWTNNPPRLVWNNALIISPYLIPLTVSRQDYVLGGLYAMPAGNSDPLPAEILRAVRDSPDLVYYHAELTGTRADQCLFITQLFRIVFHKPQLPATATATKWLKTVEPLLGVSATKVTRSGPEQLSFTRTSTVGFTALELHLLADWLESPQFPHGLHTLLAPPDKSP